MKIYAEVQTEEFWHREPNGNDSWDSGSQGLKISGVKLVRSDTHGEVVPADNGSVCVLVEHYSDGDTFGDQEYAEVKGIFTTCAEAEAFAAANTPGHGYFGSHIEWLYFMVAP